jgi:hypothetical protein
MNLERVYRYIDVYHSLSTVLTNAGELLTQTKDLSKIVFFTIKPHGFALAWAVELE